MTTLHPVRMTEAADYWTAVLTAGGSTSIPRWRVGDHSPGIAQVDRPFPRGLTTGLGRVVVDRGLRVSAALLAAHALVVRALAGEPSVVVGYREPDGQCLPCRLDVDAPSWGELVEQALAVEAELVCNGYYPVDRLRSELEVPGPRYETVVDPHAVGAALPQEAILEVALVRRGRRLVLRLRYRSEAVDSSYAGRIADYHIAALQRLVEGTDARPSGADLISDDERRRQLELAGSARPLPDRRMHEYFEDQVRAQPNAVAVEHAGTRWSYAQVNARANQIGRLLLDGGLGREDVVAVTMERTPDWLACVLAIFKAGGAYLPIEPHLPADRITRTMQRAGCSVVLTERASRDNLDAAVEALGDATVIDLDGIEAPESGSGDDAVALGVTVDAGQLAYIYFTSGSTGEPKGAMCEHAGMLNHLLAKIEDLELAPGQAVAQTAPQSFDISLWQLVAALMVGGRTVIVEQAAILDVQRFVETLACARVSVVQLVPSYLEVVLSFLEHTPADLPELHHVSATGEALKPELVRRWFAARPGIPLVNAYGLTETSDDTNHEVLTGPPLDDRVPLGRPVRGVAQYIVDEELNLVPLGAPGLIAFSGVCVGRGYVNDPERTAQAYLRDPFQPGRRLYLGGDHGRWLASGKLEFLGRKDHQVKVAGFRIELGEIENVLLKAAGVRDAAVVVAAWPGRGQQLVAFYSADVPLGHGWLRYHLTRALPAYMVPAQLHWQERLPLTGNGKIDRSRLTALAMATPAVTGSTVAPASVTERRLAEHWAQILRLPVGEIGREDHFIRRGGSSLSAVRLAVALGRVLTLKEVLANPVLADMAALLDRKAAESDALPTPS